jgi:DNA-binding XRE family transcriptional regulator
VNTPGGVSRQTINAIEAGKYSPTLELAMLVGMTLDTTLDSLFRLGHDEPK